MDLSLINACNHNKSITNPYHEVITILENNPNIHINQRDDDGCTALIHVCNSLMFRLYKYDEDKIKTYEKIVERLLLVPGINVNIIDNHMNTALINSLSYYMIPNNISKMLLGHPGIYVNNVRIYSYGVRSDESLLMTICQCHWMIETVELILKVKGVNLYYCNKRDENALIVACKVRDNYQIVSMLLNKYKEKKRDYKRIKAIGVTVDDDVRELLLS